MNRENCREYLIFIDLSSGAYFLCHMERDNNENHHQEHYFEGVEKLLEVWFTRKDGAIQHCDLRKVPRLVVKCFSLLFFSMLTWKPSELVFRARVGML